MSVKSKEASSKKSDPFLMNLSFFIFKFFYLFFSAWIITLALVFVFIFIIYAILTQYEAKDKSR